MVVEVVVEVVMALAAVVEAIVDVFSNIPFEVYKFSIFINILNCF